MTQDDNWQQIRLDHPEVKPILRCGEMKMIINKNWKNILENLPMLLKIEQSKLVEFENQPHQVINFLLTRCIKLGQLAESFEKLSLDNALRLLRVPETDIKIIRLPPAFIRVRTGEKIFAECKAIGYPSPTYDFSKSQVQLNQFKDGIIDINSASLNDSGVYECMIRQVKSNGAKTEEVIRFEVEVEQTKENKPFIATVEPQGIYVDLGTKTINIHCKVENGVDVNKLNFQWFKLDEKRNQFEAINNNDTATTANLTLTDIKYEDATLYRCEIMHKSENIRIFSFNCCEVGLSSPIEYDLKIALIIANGNYEDSDAKCANCPECDEAMRSLNIVNLNTYTAAKNLKENLIGLGYLVMAFYDLDSDYYLRVLKAFRDVCNNSKKISLLVYITGHGFNDNHQDILIPVNLKNLYHNYDHNSLIFRNIFPLTSLHNLFDSFSYETIEGQKFYMVCLWDSCRNKWPDIDIVTNRDLDINLKNETLDYSLLFSCLAGRNSFDIAQDIPDENFRKGTIFMNLFLRNLNGFNVENKIHDIAFKINSNIETFKMRPQFQNISKLKIHTTMNENFDLSDKARNEKIVCQKVESFYISPKKNIKLFNSNNQPIGICNFYPNTFINALDIVFNLKSEIYSLAFDIYPLRIDQFSNDRYTIFTLYNLFSNYQNDKIIANALDKDNNHLYSFEIPIPEHFIELRKRLNADHINQFVSIKKQEAHEYEFCLLDDIKPQSYPTSTGNSEYEETTTNDDENI